jgi:hypothetical protein
VLATLPGKTDRPELLAWDKMAATALESGLA